MGARPSSFKRGGGGRLNGVDGIITGVRYTDDFFGTAYAPGKIKDLKGKLIDKPHNLNVELSVRVDGADEDTTETLKVGNFDQWEISEDEQDVTPVEDGQQFSAKSKWSKFMGSLVKPTDGEDGFPEERLPEDTFNYSAIVGTRVRFAQAGLSQEELSNIKKLGASEKRKGKDGKEYERTDLVVEHVYSLPEDNQPAVKAGKAAVKPAAKVAAAPAKGGKPAKAAKADVSDKAVEYLFTILAANKNGINKNKLSMPILKLAAKNNETELRDEIKAWLANDDNLEGVDGVEFDRESGEIATA